MYSRRVHDDSVKVSRNELELLRLRQSNDGRNQLNIKNKTNSDKSVLFDTSSAESIRRDIKQSLLNSRKSYDSHYVAKDMKALKPLSSSTSITTEHSTRGSMTIQEINDRIGRIFYRYNCCEEIIESGNCFDINESFRIFVTTNLKNVVRSFSFLCDIILQDGTNLLEQHVLVVLREELDTVWICVFCLLAANLSNFWVIDRTAYHTIKQELELSIDFSEFCQYLSYLFEQCSDSLSEERQDNQQKLRINYLANNSVSLSIVELRNKRTINLLTVSTDDTLSVDNLFRLNLVSFLLGVFIELYSVFARCKFELLEQQEANLMNEYNSLMEQLNEKKRLEADQSTTVEQFKRLANSMKSEASELKCKVERLSSDKAELIKDKSALEVKLEVTENNLCRNQLKLKDLTLQVDQLTNELNLMTEKCKALESQVNWYESRSSSVNDLMAQIEAAEKTLSAVETAKSTLEAQLNDANSTIEKLTNERQEYLENALKVASEKKKLDESRQQQILDNELLLKLQKENEQLKTENLQLLQNEDELKKQIKVLKDDMRSLNLHFAKRLILLPHVRSEYATTNDKKSYNRYKSQVSNTADSTVDSTNQSCESIDKKFDESSSLEMFNDENNITCMSNQRNESIFSNKKIHKIAKSLQADVVNFDLDACDLLTDPQDFHKHLDKCDYTLSDNEECTNDILKDNSFGKNSLLSDDLSFYLDSDLDLESDDITCKLGSTLLSSNF